MTAEEEDDHIFCMETLGDYALNLSWFVLQFENDVYIATSEPAGNIEAVVTRKDMQPHCKL